MFDDHDPDEYGDDRSEDWQPGECDHCTGGAPVETPLGLLYCACRIGQGARPEDCACGPDED
ncbi:hypothetical protein ACIGZJ_09750 [Kitasatospora sp. NPDC052868]|uniref:hypothetical protein n=1 Tax=Kitasatospora sp. NPDC052868 TaxID=3364060 RepID=UPI0037C7B0F8